MPDFHGHHAATAIEISSATAELWDDPDVEVAHEDVDAVRPKAWHAHGAHLVAEVRNCG